MAKQTINIGASPNDGTGTPLRTAFDYCNLNFTELYTATGPSGNNIVVPGSATITGDLTVDTSTLKVDSTNNRVGIGTASPGYLLDVQAATAVANILSTTGTNTAYLQISNTGGHFYLGRENSAGTTFAAPAYSAVLYAGGAYPLVTTVNGGERYRIASDGVATWSNVGGVAGTAMTLNSTGLGVGTSPTQPLTVRSSAAAIGMFHSTNVTGPYVIFQNSTGNFGDIGSELAITGGGSAGNLTLNSRSTSNLCFAVADSVKMRIDSSGNVGIGVTPSAWGAGNKFIDINSSAAFGAFGASDAMMIGNAYWDGSSWIRKTANNAWRFVIESVSSTPTMTWQLAANGSAGSSISSWTQAMTLDASGNLLVGQTAQSVSTAGASLNSNGAIVGCVNGAAILYVNRKVNDGTLVSFLQDNTEEGTISVSGNTVSYNNFAGSHASQLQDGSKIEILRGTVMESINELCVWPNEENERLPKAKISDTAGSKKVYGVFMGWDNEWTITNDFLVTAVGAFICRVNGSVTVQEGDLLESNGDGTARVQADDIIRSSTIGKVTSKVKTHQYDDGSYCVPTVLYCG